MKLSAKKFLKNSNKCKICGFKAYRFQETDEDEQIIVNSYTIMCKYECCIIYVENDEINTVIIRNKYFSIHSNIVNNKYTIKNIKNKTIYEGIIYNPEEESKIKKELNTVSKIRRFLLEKYNEKAEKIALLK